MMAAVEEMNIRGVKFTMSDLAKRLNVSKTSLYEHFPSKNELIHNILTATIQDIQSQAEAISNNSELSFTEKIPALLKIVPTALGPINYERLPDELQNHYSNEFQMFEKSKEEHFQNLLSLIAQGIERNEIRPVDMKVLHQLLSSTMNNLLSYRFLSESNMTFPDALSAMTDIIVNGLLSKKS